MEQHNEKMDDIKKRQDFADIDIANTPYIEYEPYDYVPGCEDYVHGEERKIVLRNKATGKLEELTYVLEGGVPFSNREGYYWYWGEIKADDYHCFLTFNYWTNGELKQIAASFAGPSASSETFHKWNEQISYAAEITSMGPFGSGPFRRKKS